MIRKFIDRLLGKAPAAADEGMPPGVTLGQRVEYGVDQHKIDPKLVAEPAVRVVKTLQDAGYEAYIVGGAVRDLLVGLRPKDFDVATNATPEQVKAQFRRAFIVGRRFRLVHVIYGRNREQDQIEVSTFRAYMDNAAETTAVEGNEKTSRRELDGKSHAVDALPSSRSLNLRIIRKASGIASRARWPRPRARPTDWSRQGRWPAPGGAGR